MAGDPFSTAPDMIACGSTDLSHLDRITFHLSEDVALVYCRLCSAALEQCLDKRKHVYSKVNLSALSTTS